MSFGKRIDWNYNVNLRNMICKIAKIKLKNQIYDGIARRNHCKLVARAVCFSGFERIVSMMHCGYFNDFEVL